MSKYGELLGSNKSPEEIAQWMNADSVNYQTIEGLVNAIGVQEQDLCIACVTGEYPTPVAQRLADEAQFSSPKKGSENESRVYEQNSRKSPKKRS